MNNQKRLVYDFKNFVEKVFVPLFKKTDPAYIQWSRFAQIISPEVINYQQLHQYVESINNNIPSNYQKREIPLFKKKKEEAQQPNQEGGFNPNKTFGGQRARMMFNKGQIDDFGEQKREGGNYSLGVGGRTSPQNILPGLQKLCKIFVQNQQRMENIFSTTSKSPMKKYA